jgi:Cu(I)/Ag(I) efflux system membrane fusion protein
MNRIALTGLALTVVMTAGSAGYWAGRRGLPVPGPSEWRGGEGTRAAGEPAGTGAVIYYRDPDGKPLYSAEPRRTGDGRAYRAVRASEDVSFDEPAAPPARTTEAKAERRLLYYRNPMGLPDTSPVPKKDGMGMDYLPVYAGEDGDGTVVTLSPGRIQRSGVRFERVSRQLITRPIRVPGTVQLDERRIAVVATRSDAFIQEVAAVTTGDRVAKGDRLVRIYSPEITAAGAQFLTELNAAARGVPEGGARQRLENLGVPPEIVAEIERSRKVPLTINWSAPRDGIVLERNAIEGMRAQPGDILFRIADTSLVWAMVDVAERDLGAIAVGQPVNVRTRSLSGRQFAGKVNVIYPQVNRETRTTRVRIELTNADLALLPDMYIDASIETGGADPVVSVPESAVIDTGTRQSVFIDKGQGRFEPRGVGLGRRGGGYVEIREGVADGEPVVISANFLIDAESNLKAALKGFSDARSPQ